MLTTEQAFALAAQIADDAPTPEGDAAALARLNTTPTPGSECWLTERTLATNPAIGAIGAATLIFAIEQAAAALNSGATADDERIRARLLMQASTRLLTDGLDFASKATLDQLDEVALQIPGVAALAPAIKAMVPMQARSILGRDATLDDLSRARSVAARRGVYELALVEALADYNAGVDADLAAPGS